MAASLVGAFLSPIPFRKCAAVRRLSSPTAALRHRAPRKWAISAVPEALEPPPPPPAAAEPEPVEAQIAASEVPKGEDAFAIVMDEPGTSRISGDIRIMKFEENIQAQHLMDKTNEHTGSSVGFFSTNSVKHDQVPLFDIRSGLRLALLIGLITYQGSQQAVASTEFPGVAQINTYIGDLGDISTGFASAFLLIFFSELGDKTFFIAALLAARNSGPVIFVGTFGALAAMSIISVILGRTFHYVDDLLPFRLGETEFPIDDFAAFCLLVYFGVSTLLEAASGDGLKIKEEQEEAEVAISDLSRSGAGIMAAANTVISTFLLVFVAEWGDKSFFSTIALAAASSPLGVIGGALAGHALATLLAVLGGSILGTFLSEKIVAYIGGTLFLVFAAVTLIEIVSGVPSLANW